ncbi:MAG: ATP-grasp domain-containing protein [bacterium]
MVAKKGVYIIGGGPLGLNVIRWAKELGLLAIVTDKNERAPGLEMADIPFVADAADVTRHLDFVGGLAGQFKIVGVYCGNEIGVWTVYHLSKLLNLEHNSEEALTNVLDKARMKEIWQRCSLPAPRFHTARDARELAQVVEAGDYPLIAKPALGSGSRGVQILHAQDDPRDIFDRCLQAVNGQGDVIAEEYLSGRSIDANGVFIADRFFPAGILEKYITDPPDCLPVVGTDPAMISKNERREVYASLEIASRALGFTFGPVKGDFIRTDKGYQILEVAPRFHGDVTTCNTLPFGSGINPVKFYFHYLQTGEVRADFLKPARINYATWRVICLPPGKLKQKLPCDFQGATPEQITKVWYNPRCSMAIQRYADTTKIPGYICAYGDDQQETENLIAQFFEDQQYAMDVNSQHLDWYEQLGKRIEDLGFSRSSFGFVDCS